jgi:hypothetical protein
VRVEAASVLGSGGAFSEPVIAALVQERLRSEIAAEATAAPPRATAPSTPASPGTG